MTKAMDKYKQWKSTTVLYLLIFLVLAFAIDTASIKCAEYLSTIDIELHESSKETENTELNQELEFEKYVKNNTHILIFVLTNARVGNYSAFFTQIEIREILTPPPELS